MSSRSSSRSRSIISVVEVAGALKLGAVAAAAVVVEAVAAVAAAAAATVVQVRNRCSSPSQIVREGGIRT